MMEYYLCRCLTIKPTTGIPEVVDCRQGLAEIRNAMVQGTQRFIQVRAAESVTPYILCGCLYCLEG